MTTFPRPAPIDGLDAALVVRLLAMARSRNLPLRAAVEAASGLDGRPRLSRVLDRLSAAGEEGLLEELGASLKAGGDPAAAASLEALRRADLPAAGLLELSRWLGARDSQRSRFLLAIGYPLSIAVTACFVTAFLVDATVGLFAVGELHSELGTLRRLVGTEPGAIESLALLARQLAVWVLQHPATIIAWAAFVLLASAGTFVFGARIQDRAVALAIPGLGRYVRLSGARTFCATLHGLLRAGLPAPEALEIAATAVPNVSLRRSLGSLSRSTAEGEGLGELLRGTTALPAFVRWRLWSAYFRSDLVAELSRTWRALDVELAVSERRVTDAASALSWGLAFVALCPVVLYVAWIVRLTGIDLLPSIG